MVSVNEIPENGTAFRFTLYHHAALLCVQGTSLLASLRHYFLRTFSVSIPYFRSAFAYATLHSLDLRFYFTADFVLVSASQLALLTFLPPFHFIGATRAVAD